MARAGVRGGSGPGYENRLPPATPQVQLTVTVVPASR